MQFKTNKLTGAIAFAMVAGVAATAGAGTAFAQEGQSAQQLERITVTGSRIRAVETEAANPVFTIDRAALQAQGVASVSDVLQNMSASGSPAISRSQPLLSGETVGGQYVNLRDLGSSRTLVLVDGKRLPISTSGSQDISAVPNVMVERIDILKDGASSTYGSDAMAGVVNIITRKNFDGAEAEVYFGEYSQGDGTKQRVSGAVGVSGERGYITVGAEYREEDGVWARHRFFSADNYPGFPNLSYTTVGQWGTWRAASSDPWQAPNKGGTALGANQFHTQACPDDCSVPADQMHVETPVSARTLYLSSGFDLTDKITWNNSIGYSNREAVRQIAGYPYQSAAFGTPMSADSYFNPTAGASDVFWRRRGWEMPRVSTSDLTSWRFVTSLEGSFNIGESRYMDWEVGYSYAENKLQTLNTGNFNIANVAAAVGPSFMNAQGVVQCGTAANPISLSECVPWNPFAGFGTGAVANSLDDPNVRNFLFPVEHALGNTSTRMAFATISGNLFTLPAGDLAYAVGVERRTEEGSYAPDAMAQAGMTTNLASGPTGGRYSVNEAFLELHIPVLADVTGFKELSFDLATRYSDYDTFGETTNSKFGLKWKPIDDLLVRGTWAQGFRAPTISQLYGGGSDTFDTFADPCDSVYGVARATAACQAAVPPGFRQLKAGFLPSDGPTAQTPVPFRSGSNPLLQPETSRSWTAGLVWSPSNIDGLNVSLDWWRIRIERTMVGDTASAILADCYLRGIASRCGQFQRDPSQGYIVTNLLRGQRNAGYADVEGFDLGLNYRLETENAGNFGLKWESTYMSRYETKSTDDDTTPISQEVSMGSTFRLRSNMSLNWEYGDFGVSWSARYYSAMKEACTFSTTAYDARYCNMPNYASPATRGVVTPMHRNGSTTFHDLQLTMKAPWNATIAVGANNVFNRFGPVMFSQPNSNFAYYGGMDIGRFVYMKYTQRF